jgi:hypothetical protein
MISFFMISKHFQLYMSNISLLLHQGPSFPSHSELVALAVGACPSQDWDYSIEAVLLLR